jgi:DMSO reductase anchor subunit
MAANVEPKSTEEPLEEKLLSKWETWVGIVAAVVIVGVTAVGVVASSGHLGHERPVCP